jgi:hypothetical protein
MLKGSVSMKRLVWSLWVCLVLSGCATSTGEKIYYHHPEKTPADREMDYTRCMRSIDTQVTIMQPEIAEHLAACMKSKGYEVLTEKEANERGITIPKVWPPRARRSSSTGPW